MKRPVILALISIALSFSGLSAETVIPDFVNKEANHISGELPRFKGSLQALAEGADSVVRILHIGDSHIQAEFVTNSLRGKLQQQYGNAGRGLTVPLRLAGTNQSHDFAYSVGDKKALSQTRLLKFPWPMPPGVTGISVCYPEATECTLKVPGQEFCKYSVITSEGTGIFSMTEPADSVSFSIAPHECLYGVSVENGKSGILYSAIGNNGACYTDYSLIAGFPQLTSQFDADLIILSMGTNEGFSTMSDEDIYRSVVNLVRSLRAFNPKAEFLILTPMECQRNRNHGSKPLSPYFDINDRVTDARNIILRAANDEKVAVWDFYEIAGRHGTSDKWLDAGLMNKDRIHLLRPGYEVQAQLLYDAIIN